MARNLGNLFKTPKIKNKIETSLRDNARENIDPHVKTKVVNAKEIYVNGSALSASPLTTKGDIYTYSTAGTRLAVGTNDQALLADSTAATGLKWGTINTGAIIFIIDGGGAEITTGIKGDIVIPFACTITKATLLADQSGSIVVDLWKDTYANFPPTDADSITASAPPTITTATKSQDATLTGWTTSVTADDILRFNVDSVTTIERVTVILHITRDL